MLSVILVEPKTPGNIGAVARVMKNFGFADLILINPKCKHLSPEALDRASHAQDILKKAKVISSIPTMDYLIATTGKLGTDYNLKRSPLSPKELAKKVKGLAREKLHIGLMFGREDTGLMNKEIEQADFTVTVNTSKKYPIMNLSHAVSIVLYELWELKSEGKINTITPVGAKEKKALLNVLHASLDAMKFSTPQKRETQKLVWKRIIGKSMLTKREFMAMMGFFKKNK